MDDTIIQVATLVLEGRLKGFMSVVFGKSRMVCRRRWPMIKLMVLLLLR